MLVLDRLVKIAEKERRSDRFLCEVVGKSAGYVRDLKAGKGTPSLEMIDTWAVWLHTTRDYLTGATDDPTHEQLTLTPDEGELLDTYRSMNREGRRAAIGAVRGLAMLPEYAGECPVFSAQIEKSPGKAEA